MAKLTLSPITDNDHAVTMNANLDLIEAAIENTLSRDGTSPNQMNDEFDLNSNFIINMPPGTDAVHPLQKQQIEALITAGVGGGAITLNSLVDVTVPAPTVLDVLTFDGVNWINAPSLAIPFPILTDTILRSNGATYVEGSNRLRVDANGVLTFRDVSGNDTLAISHPGTDALFAFVNTGDLNITGLTGRINQGAEVLAFVSELSTVSELSDLSDVNTSTPTNRFVLIADGVDFESRALEAADIPFAGDISSSGTPLNDQIAVFVDGSTIEGDPQFEWDGVNKRLEIFGSGLSNRVRIYHDDTDTQIQNVNGGGLILSGYSTGVTIDMNPISSAVKWLTVRGDPNNPSDPLISQFINDSAGETGCTILNVFGNLDTTPGKVQIFHEGANSISTPIVGGPSGTQGGIGTSGAATDFLIFTDSTMRAIFDGTTGQFSLQNYGFPVADGSPGQILETDGGGNLSFVTPAGGGIANVVEDLTPQLGGFLDLNGNSIRASNAAGPEIVDEAATATNPTLIPNQADLDTGIGWNSANRLALVAGGNEGVVVRWTGADIQVFNQGVTICRDGVRVEQINGGMMVDENASGTNPTLLPSQSDLDTGIGWAAGAPSDSMSLIAGGVEAFRIDESGAAIELTAFGDLSAGDAAGPAFLNEAATDLNPTLVPNKTDPDTGMGWAFSGMFSLIGNGAELARGFTPSLGGLHVNNTLTGAGLERVLTTADISAANDAVQARRTSVYTLTTAFVDITMDTTDVETDAAVLDHDLVTNTDNIIAGVTGTYEVAVDYDVISTAVSGDPVISVDTRVRVNDAGTGILGSIIAPYSYRDGSVGGADGNISKHISNSFLVSLTAADFITLQLGKTEITGSETFEVSNICVKVKRLI